MPRITDSASLRSLIRARRRELGITQEELAVAVGRSRKWVTRFEQGAAEPSLDAALRALTAVGMRVDAVLEPESAADVDLTAGVDGE